MRYRELRGPMYSAWQQMIRRCTQPSNDRYRFYGGRGVSVCDRWLSFDAFLEDMGPRPTPKHSVDRVDNDGNYEPSNCRWATVEEQRNNKRNNVLLTYQGRTQTASRWARELGMSPFTVLERVRKGWPTEKALGLRAGYRRHMITINGVTLSMKEWSVRSGVGYWKVKDRLKRGWTPEQACELS